MNILGKKKTTLNDVLETVKKIFEVNSEILNVTKEILNKLSENNENSNNSDNSVMPIVDYRFGEQYYVNDFLQLNNPTLKNIIAKLAFGDSMDSKVKAVAEYIKKNYEYPFMAGNVPSCSGQFKRFQKDANFRDCYWQETRDYMWSFPAECAVQGYGICIDTSNLAEALLRMLDVPAKVCLGAVYETKSGQLLGYHAWIEVPYKGEQYVLETTIHPSGENLLPARVVYGRKMGVFYVKEAEYNESEYKEIQS